ncbi:hypothetical protein VTK56DRAFT_5119 [Thermocarpiscus australiensis]
MSSFASGADMASPANNNTDTNNNLQATLAGPAPIADMGLPGKCSLLSMPQEILHNIFELVIHGNDTKSLSRLARTCHALHRNVMPILYRCILDPDPYGQPHPHDRANVTALVITLLRNPNLRPLIRSICLLDTTLTLYGWGRADQQTIQIYNGALMQLFGINPYLNPQAVKHPVGQLLLAALAPNLTRLELRMGTCWRDTNFLLNYTTNRQGQRRMTGPRLRFAHLRALTVYFREDWWQQRTGGDRGASLQKLNGLLHAAAASLEELTVWHARSGTSLTARLARLTTVRLPEAYLSARGLRHLLRDAAGLRRFALTHDRRVAAPGTQPTQATPNRCAYLPVSPGQVLDCLPAVTAQTLTDLLLAPYVPPVLPAGADYPMLTELGRFARLRTVIVDYRALERRLPPRNDHDALVRLLRGCGDLRRVAFVCVERFEPREFARLVEAAVVRMEWPLLREVLFECWRGQTPAEGRLLFQSLDRVFRLALDWERRRLERAGVRVQVVPYSIEQRHFAQWRV